MILTLKFKFDAAHRLMNYEGPCHNIHGHTWRVKIVIEGDVDPTSNMVVDFKLLKDAINKHIIEVFDHAIIVSDKDCDLKAFLKSQKFKYQLTPGDPTCEEIARMIYYWTQAEISQKLLSVEVWESDTASAIYKRV